MSVELSFVIDGECDHGPKYVWEERAECNHRLPCKWGEVEHPDPRPDLGQVGHLMLAVGWWVGSMLGKPARFDRRYGYTRVTSHDDRLFMHIDHDTGQWTWELFPAHFDDGEGPADLFIGRWPD